MKDELTREWVATSEDVADLQAEGKLPTRTSWSSLSRHPRCGCAVHNPVWGGLGRWGGWGRRHHCALRVRLR